MVRDVSAIEEENIYSSHVIRNSISVWGLGIINNFHFTLVLSASNSIAEGYGMKKLVALITWANVFFGIFSRLLNAFVLTFLSYNIRVLSTCILVVIAILLLSFAWDISGHNDLGAFIVTLLGVVILGSSTSYSESVFLGFFERMPSKLIGAWSSGTGFSGVVATLIMLGLTAAGLSIKQIFLITIPLVAVFGLCFFFGLYMPFRVPVECCGGGAESNPVNQTNAEMENREWAQEYIYKARTNWSGTPWTNIVSAARRKKPECMRGLKHVNRLGYVRSASSDGLEEEFFDIEVDERISKWARWKREIWPMIREMHSLIFWNNMNLSIVYTAEYAVQFMAPFSFICNQNNKNQNFLLKHSFVISQLCYQFGVLISRSSLLCIRIRHVWIFSVIQTLNAIAWLCQAKLKFMSDETNLHREVVFACVLFVWMIFVGLMGGASYVNVFYNILVQTKAMEQCEKDDITAFVRNSVQCMSAPSNVSREGKDVGNNSFSLSSGLPEEKATYTPKNDSALLHSDSVEEACDYIASVWKEKRDLAMNIGALYATIGVTLGSLLDVFFTAVLLGEEKC